jgi:hypothetical protein
MTEVKITDADIGKLDGAKIVLRFLSLIHPSSMLTKTGRRQT